MSSGTLVIGCRLSLLSVLVGGCSGPDKRAAPEMQSVPVSIQSKTDTVKIVAMKFVPSEITVAKGTTIIFINNDIVTHDITEEANKAWSSNLLAPSKSWSMIPEKSANYYCSIHVVMKGKIIITQK
jgi:plastocyanin